eukprot:scaffold51410_cov36-Prasinocladus_malaysianus.AAC.8
MAGLKGLLDVLRVSSIAHSIKGRTVSESAIFGSIGASGKRHRTPRQAAWIVPTGGCPSGATTMSCLDAWAVLNPLAALTCAHRRAQCKMLGQDSSGETRSIGQSNSVGRT